MCLRQPISVFVKELEHVNQCLAVEKQSNGELTEGIRKQRRAVAKQDAEAAGREHKHQDEVQQLRKVGSLLLLLN